MAALQVILLTNEEGSGRFAGWDAELVLEADFKLLCSQVVFVGGIESDAALVKVDTEGWKKIE